jgi:hypothetical protein
MTFKFADKRETVGHNKCVVFSTLVKHSIGGVEGGLFLGALGISEPTYSCTILPLLTIFERVLGGGRYVAYNVRGV